MLEKAIFGAGCFWHVQETFSQLKGVISTSVGYSGGNSDNPTYQQVCSGATGHAEVVEIVFNPNIITYEKLLDVFWHNHDPTTIDRQGPDKGHQYRSVIYYFNSQQKNTAELSKQKFQKSGKINNSIVTEIKPVMNYYKAEEYHQNYFNKTHEKFDLI